MIVITQENNRIIRIKMNYSYFNHFNHFSLEINKIHIKNNYDSNNIGK